MYNVELMLSRVEGVVIKQKVLPGAAPFVLSFLFEARQQSAAQHWSRFTL